MEKQGKNWLSIGKWFTVNEWRRFGKRKGRRIEESIIKYRRIKMYGSITKLIET